MRKRLTLAACILGSTIVFVDSSVVTVALPAMERDLGGGLALQQWVADAYLLTLGSLILVGGSLGDLYGQKRVFVIGVVAFAITSVFCAVAWDEGALIVARGAQGVAGALLTPASLATISVIFAGEERGAAIGTWTAYTGIAFLVGPLIGGWLVSAVSWRGIFLSTSHRHRDAGVDRNRDPAHRGQGRTPTSTSSEASCARWGSPAPSTR